MRIAFDVKGTLDGYYEVKVKHLLKLLYDEGHEILVWSNSFSYAVDMVEKLKEEGIFVYPERKYSKVDAEMQDLPLMDIAIEDDVSQTYLGATVIVIVKELPDITEEYVKKLTENG